MVAHVLKGRRYLCTGFRLFGHFLEAVKEQPIRGSAKYDEECPIDYSTFDSNPKTDRRLRMKFECCKYDLP